MKRRIKTKKKKIKKYKSRNKLKSRKSKRNHSRYKKKKTKKKKKVEHIKAGMKPGLEPPALPAPAVAEAAAGLTVGAGTIAYMGKDGPRKCMFEDCQSHYYHFPGNRGWWDSPTRFYQGGKKANRLEKDYDGENPVCPSCVKRYDKGIRNELLIKTLNGYKVCDNSCRTCKNKFCGDSWWKPDENSIYKELEYYIRSINNPYEWEKIKHKYETKCPECKVSIRKGVCLKCKKHLELMNGGLDYCISCKGYGNPKEIFNLNGIELTVGGILIFLEDSKEYKAMIEGIFDNQLLRCEILSLNINEWNDIELPWLRNKQDSDEVYTKEKAIQDSDEVYMKEKTIIVINDLQICLRRLSLAKLYDLNPDLKNCIKEILDIILKPNVKPWVSIDDPPRSKYKSLLKSKIRSEQSRIDVKRDREVGDIWRSHPY